MRSVSFTKSICTFALALVFVAAGMLADTRSASAQRGKLPLVRDAEIELLMKDYAKPIIDAAGLRSGAVEIFLINRQEFNAFVTGSRMFFHIGAIMQSQTPNEIIGVLAHETGHIIGGHLGRLRDRLEQAQAMAVIGAILGGAAIATGGEGGSAAGSALILGSQQAAVRSLLSYQRNEEIAADRTAVSLMEIAGMSPEGIIKTFKTISKGSLFASSRGDPYARSHPLPRDRISLLEELINKSKYRGRKDPPALQLRHDMARAKIAAYTGGAGVVRSLFPRSLTSAPARYGNAISQYLSGNTKNALQGIEKLISEQPRNAYLHEMKGEILLRSGNPRAAIQPFRDAIKLDRSKSNLLRIQLGHAYLESGDKKLLDASIKELLAAVGRDRNTPRAYGLLARAYAAKGDQVRALAFSAEERFYMGRLAEARQLALRAQPKLKRGEPQWLRLQDILDYKPVK